MARSPVVLVSPTVGSKTVDTSPESWSDPVNVSGQVRLANPDTDTAARLAYYASRVSRPEALDLAVASKLIVASALRQSLRPGAVRRARQELRRPAVPGIQTGRVRARRGRTGHRAGLHPEERHDQPRLPLAGQPRASGRRAGPRRQGGSGALLARNAPPAAPSPRPGSAPPTPRSGRPSTADDAALHRAPGPVGSPARGCARPVAHPAQGHADARLPRRLRPR